MSSVQPRRLPLHDRAVFWLAVAGTFIVLGGILIGIGTPIALAVTPAAWNNPLFVIGAVIVAIGVLCLWWALTLYVAHRHAEHHWCPDVAAHTVAPPGSSERSTPPEPSERPNPAPPSSLHGTSRLLTGPPIPIPPYTVAIRIGSPEVFLAVTNSDSPHSFRAQLIDVDGARQDVATPWAIPWRDHSEAEAFLFPDMTQLLHLGTGDGMGNARDLTAKKQYYGRFELPAVGAEATIIEPDGLAFADLAGRERLFLLRVRIYCDGAATDFGVHLGFHNRNDETGNLHVAASVVDWDAR